jgi:hypothetical protein
VTLYANHHGHWASWTFYSALGEKRGTFGVHLTKIAAEFKLDIEDRLAESCLPRLPIRTMMTAILPAVPVQGELPRAKSKATLPSASGFP